MNKERVKEIISFLYDLNGQPKTPQTEMQVILCAIEFYKLGGRFDDVY